jgi:GNAT superfamily N-acetyltransferase
VYLIAWLDDAPVGNLCLILDGPDNIHARDGLVAGPEINAFDVVPQLRNRGIGSRLIAAAEHLARDLGHTATVLGVEVDNHSAHRLYRRLGYRDWPHGETRDSYTWTDDGGIEHVQEESVVWMEKRFTVVNG